MAAFYYCMFTVHCVTVESFREVTPSTPLMWNQTIFCRDELQHGHLAHLHTSAFLRRQYSDNLHTVIGFPIIETNDTVHLGRLLVTTQALNGYLVFS